MRDSTSGLRVPQEFCKQRGRRGYRTTSLPPLSDLLSLPPLLAVLISKFFSTYNLDLKLIPIFFCAGRGVYMTSLGAGHFMCFFKKKCFSDRDLFKDPGGPARLGQKGCWLEIRLAGPDPPPGGGGGSGLRPEAGWLEQPKTLW